jgi:hypothetical protein
MFPFLHEINFCTNRCKEPQKWTWTDPIRLFDRFWKCLYKILSCSLKYLFHGILLFSWNCLNTQLQFRCWSSRLIFRVFLDLFRKILRICTIWTCLTRFHVHGKFHLQTIPDTSKSSFCRVLHLKWVHVKNLLHRTHHLHRKYILFHAFFQTWTTLDWCFIFSDKFAVSLGFS